MSRIISAVILILFQLISFAQNELRIGIKINQPLVHLTSNYPIEITNGDEKKSFIIDVDKSLTCAYLREGTAVSETDGRLFFITKTPVTCTPKPPLNSNEIPYISVYSDDIKNAHYYRGCVEVDFTPVALNVINIIGVEDYLRGVVATEMKGGYPLEALKAQAIAARTYAERGRGKMKSLGFDMDDTVRFQAYGGLKAEETIVNKAIDATSGMVLMYKNQLADTVFSGNCGGWTESSDCIWGNNIPYLQSVSDMIFEKNADRDYTAYWTDFLTNFKLSYCLQPKYDKVENYRWLKIISIDELEQNMPTEYQVGKISDFSITERGKSGRITKLKIIGVDKSIVVEKESNIRRIFSGLKSSAFVIECYRDGNGTPVVFVLRGGGYGHGVGLCQVGAAGRADAGWDYERILKYYYPGTTLQKK